MQSLIGIIRLLTPNRDVKKLDKETTIKTLNKFLKGIYMGIHSYEHFIQKMSNSPLKEAFVAIQKEQKNHATMIAERIQQLGGTPVTNEGMIGKLQADISNFFKKLNTDEDILKHAIKGENIYGIRMTEDLVRDKLDQESLNLVKSILNKDREQVDYLKSLLHN